jgi:hypothetical protein
LPIAKGVCCGFISLKIVLIIIALIDITFGGAAIGIGITAFMRFHLHLSLAAYVVINSISFILAFGCLYAIVTKDLRLLRFYYIWKCMEVIIIPIFEILILTFTVGSTEELSERPSINYYIIVLVKAMIRLYFAYLIFSYYMRLDRGESLLVEDGERKLSKMIDQIKEE